MNKSQCLSKKKSMLMKFENLISFFWVSIQKSTL